MATRNSHVTLIGAICLGITCVPLAASATRSLQQQSAVARTATAITVVDFSTLPDVLASKDPFDVPEIQLESQVNLSIGTSAEDAEALEPAQVQRLVQAVHSEIDPIPATEAAQRTVIQFPGAILRGEYANDVLATESPRRLRSVFAPFRSGTVFSLQGSNGIPGTSLIFSNMTLLLPNVTFAGTFASGLMSYFDFPHLHRFCFINSVLLLKSCNGFTPNTYQIWCCTAYDCNNLSSQQALTNIGFDVEGDLEIIQCYSAEAEPITPPPPPPPPPAPAVQEALDTGVRVADFSNLPDDIAAYEYSSMEHRIPEIQLADTVRIGRSVGASTMYGTYFLGPEQVMQLADVISTHMASVPPGDAAETQVVEFTGLALAVRGESVLDTLSVVQPRRIPTVFAPFHAGTKFSVQGRDTPPGTTLNFANMTLLLPNVTYEGIYESGFLDFFDLRQSARICFTNSILALKSCEGYTPNTYHMWCCTAQQCNILYTQQAIEDLGSDRSNNIINDDLEYIQCYAAEPSPGALSPGAAAPSPTNVVPSPVAYAPGAGEPSQLQAGIDPRPSGGAPTPAPAAAAPEPSPAETGTSIIVVEASADSKRRAGTAAVHCAGAALAVLAFAGV